MAAAKKPASAAVSKARRPSEIKSGYAASAWVFSEISRSMVFGPKIAHALMGNRGQ